MESKSKTESKEEVTADKIYQDILKAVKSYSYSHEMYQEYLKKRRTSTEKKEEEKWNPSRR